MNFMFSKDVAQIILEFLREKKTLKDIHQHLQANNYFNQSYPTFTNKFKSNFIEVNNGSDWEFIFDDQLNFLNNSDPVATKSVDKTKEETAKKIDFKENPAKSTETKVTNGKNTMLSTLSNHSLENNKEKNLKEKEITLATLNGDIQGILFKLNSLEGKIRRIENSINKMYVDRNKNKENITTIYNTLSELLKELNTD